MNIKEKKNNQLGLDFGTASNQLRKSILFKYATLAGDYNCFQCGLPIKSIEEFSIEHKIPWLDSEDPKKLFFNLDNIGFSHLSCNRKAARITNIMSHPSNKAYDRGCRCKECTELNRIKQQKYRMRRKGLPEDT